MIAHLSESREFSTPSAAPKGKDNPRCQRAVVNRRPRKPCRRQPHAAEKCCASSPSPSSPRAPSANRSATTARPSASSSPCSQGMGLRAAVRGKRQRKKKRFRKSEARQVADREVPRRPERYLEFEGNDEAELFGARTTSSIKPTTSICCIKLIVDQASGLLTTRSTSTRRARSRRHELF